MDPVQDPSRLLIATTLVLIYGSVCWWYLARYKQQAKPVVSQVDWLVAYASQSGNAQQLAEQSCTYLQNSGLKAQCCTLNQLRVSQLQQQSIIFIVSTYGDGEAPDNAHSFFKQLQKYTAPLDTQYVLLALGDSTYPHFCAFGKQLAIQLERLKAQPLFPLHCLDRLNHNELTQWHKHLGQALSLAPLAIETTKQTHKIRLIQRESLNPNSASPQLYLLIFESEFIWQAGDILQITPFNDSQYRIRDYSIASAAHQPLQIIVRLEQHPDYGNGLCSYWLTQDLALNTTLEVQLRSNSNFHATKHDNPAIFIGAGSGIAGLRGHLQERATTGKSWLLFGERSAIHDRILQAELNTWQQHNPLFQVDLAYSRDSQSAQYVQDLLYSKAAQVKQWAAENASIYVCGRLNGMGEGVHTALIDILGSHYLEQLLEQGRYKRDLY